MTTMKAIIIQTDQPNNPLIWQETEASTPTADEVLVDIYASALNRADLSQRAGNYPPPPGVPNIMGLEMAGKITAVGVNVRDWQVGDRVCALLPSGGYAEQTTVPQQMLMPIPDDWTYLQAAAVPEVFYTAYVNLFIEAGLHAAETVLIHGGASGVGTAAIQMTRETGCRTIVTAGAADKIARCQDLGADLAINYKTDDFVEQVQAYTDGEGVDVILDVAGASYLERNLTLLKRRGRLVFIATLGGSKAEVNIGLLMVKRLRLIGSVLRSRSLAEKVKIKVSFMERFWPLLLDGRIEPIIDTVYPVAEAEAAQQYMAENKNIGKIMLEVRKAGVT